MVLELAKEKLKKLSAMQRYELKRQMESMDKYSGRATELISLYVPLSKPIFFVTSYLKNEYSQSSNIKSKSTRKNVMAAIESIISRLKSFKKPPENGIVFFVGHVATSGDQTSMVQHVIEPPLPITTFLYRCDSKFYLEPINNMMVDEDTYGLIVVDRSEATIGYLRGKRIEVVKYIPSRVPSKHGRGGQSQRRFERLIEIAAHEFFKKVGDLVNEAFLEEKHLRGILVGGPGATKDFFVEKNYLHHELKRKVVDLFDTGYTDEYGLRELVEKAAKALYDLDLMREKRFVQKLMDEIRKSDGGLSVYGEKPVLDAVKNGVVDTLLVSDGLRKYKLKYICPNCGNIIEEVKSKNEGNLKSCPKCESDMSFDSGEDIIESLLKLSEAAGTKMELISADSAEGDMFLKAFSGLAGILRYKVAG